MCIRDRSSGLFEMWPYLQVLIPLCAVGLAGALCIGVVSFSVAGGAGRGSAAGHAVKAVGRNGYVQRFAIIWIPTYFGRHRPILVCNHCRGGAIRLFGHCGAYACRFCHRAQYLSQKQKTASRKRLAATKLRLKLRGWPDIREPMPSKPKWTRRRTYQRIRHQIQALEAQAKQTRFRKEIDIRTFSYHVADLN